ncbi:MAG: hypothetical protein GC191_07550 [Azospirillum sp.]|nr:hypothetical protein [Azospirillum sp.]
MIDRLLHEEHLQTLATLNALESRLAGSGAKRPLDRSAPADRTLIDSLLAMFERETGRHFRFEEEHLFPRLDDCGFGQITAMLAGEHETLRQLAASLGRLAGTAGREDMSAAAWSTFRSTATELIDTAMFHIQKEEMGIISRLGMFLDADDSERLAVAYQKLEATAPA